MGCDEMHGFSFFYSEQNVTELITRNERLETQISDMKRTWEKYLELVQESQAQLRREAELEAQQKCLRILCSAVCLSVSLRADTESPVRVQKGPVIIKPVRKSFLSRLTGSSDSTPPAQKTLNR